MSISEDEIDELAENEFQKDNPTKSWALQAKTNGLGKTSKACASHNDRVEYRKRARLMLEAKAQQK